MWAFLVCGVLFGLPPLPPKQVYFLALKDGTFNTFDFVIVIVSVAFSPHFTGQHANVANLKV